MITCGIFFIDKNDKILIVHPTNASMKRWSIPKGGIDKGETEEQAAKRELLEETSIDLNKLGGELIPIGHSQYTTRNKTLSAFAYEYDDVYTGKLKCTSFVDNKFPEVDKFKWVGFIEAFVLLHPTQQDLLQHYLKTRK